jgi:hypothetical protein
MTRYLSNRCIFNTWCLIKYDNVTFTVAEGDVKSAKQNVERDFLGIKLDDIRRHEKDTNFRGSPPPFKIRIKCRRAVNTTSHELARHQFES